MIRVLKSSNILGFRQQTLGQWTIEQWALEQDICAMDNGHLDHPKKFSTCTFGQLPLQQLTFGNFFFFSYCFFFFVFLVFFAYYLISMQYLIHTHSFKKGTWSHILIYITFVFLFEILCMVHVYSSVHQMTGSSCQITCWRVENCSFRRVLFQTSHRKTQACSGMHLTGSNFFFSIVLIQ